MSDVEQRNNRSIDNIGSLLFNIGIFTLNGAFLLSFAGRYNNIGIFLFYFVFVIVGLYMRMYAYKNTEVKEDKCVRVCKE
jgi:uncharacterized membrane protein